MVVCVGQHNAIYGHSRKPILEAEKKKGDIAKEMSINTKWNENKQE